ncbi:hypothetical protein Salat_0171900 [Sesamum alatum]|uniref:Transmembrane protein n=1 Tax=Sesamum alatum TaxID=300844 RepID=A0AAE1YZ48_9LAMI|nr:hypothetical protein Salat_0171900 [Sesamum alatum]
MSEISSGRGFRLHLVFFASIFLLFVSAYSDDSPTPKTEIKMVRHGGSNRSMIAIICLVLATVALLSFFLFKYWQKKKRDEQYARLLKLFEEDDELEVELGLRD